MLHWYLKCFMVTKGVINHNFSLFMEFYCVLNIVNNSKHLIQCVLTGTAEHWVFYATNRVPNWKKKQSILVKLLIYMLKWHKEKECCIFL